MTNKQKTVFEEYIFSRSKTWQRLCEWDGALAINDFEHKGLEDINFLKEKNLIKLDGAKIIINKDEPVGILMLELYSKVIIKSLQDM